MKIDKNNPNHIFVFGSNTEGKHGKGAALHARKHYGAIYGRPVGLHGRSYAIMTKQLRVGLRSIPLDQIQYQLENLKDFAELRPHLTFFCTKIGTGLAGYTEQEIKALFDAIIWPDNVVLPDWS